MSEIENFKVIGRIHTDFSEKFGIPRQSGLVKNAKGVIIMGPEYRSSDAFRGLSGYSHIHLLWLFSKSKKEHVALTVTPPRLGGRKRMGVFATRSNYRPNPIGLSVVQLDSIEYHEELGTILHVSGVDLLDDTPILDIKPYLPYADSYPDAKSGFAGDVFQHKLHVQISEELLAKIPGEHRDSIIEILEQDPRTAYIHDEKRIWGVAYGGVNVRFFVKEDILQVVEVSKLSS